MIHQLCVLVGTALEEVHDKDSSPGQVVFTTRNHCTDSEILSVHQNFSFASKFVDNHCRELSPANSANSSSLIGRYLEGWLEVYWSIVT